MANESQVTTFPDSTGKKVRTIEVTTLIDGTPTTVEMQVLAIADSQGNLIDRFADYNSLQQIVEELKLTRSLLERWLGPVAFDAPGHQPSMNVTT